MRKSATIDSGRALDIKQGKSEATAKIDSVKKTKNRESTSRESTSNIGTAKPGLEKSSTSRTNVAKSEKVKVTSAMLPATDADVEKHLTQAMKQCGIADLDQLSKANIDRLNYKLRDLIKKHEQRRFTTLCIKCKKAGVMYSSCPTCNPPAKVNAVNRQADGIESASQAVEQFVFDSGYSDLFLCRSRRLYQLYHKH